MGPLSPKTSASASRAGLMPPGNPAESGYAYDVSRNRIIQRKAAVHSDVLDRQHCLYIERHKKLTSPRDKNDLPILQN